MALATIPPRYCSGGPHKIRDNWLGEVERLCIEFHVLVSSGYRTATQNREAGGAPNSDHLRGDAADFVGPAPDELALFKYAVGHYPYVEPMAQARSHVHISFAHGGISTPVGGETKHIKSLKGAAAVRAIVAACRRHQMDWKAVAAVSFEEGATGYIGDHGTSYGPWHMHIGGALPARWARLGANSAKTQAWSWSQPGIEYAIAHMASAGARGRAGRNAVHEIVYTFEKPANKELEAKNAELQYEFLGQQGGDAERIAATWFYGPRTSATAPLVEPAFGPAPPIKPREVKAPGVAKAWREIIDAAAVAPRRADTQIRKLGESLIDIVKG